MPTEGNAAALEAALLNRTTTPLDSNNNDGETMEALLEGLNHVRDVSVRRSGPDANMGYAWTVTFADCAPGGLNEGDLVPINIPEASIGDDLEVEVSEVRPGARSGGRAEVQVLRIYGDVDASTNETQPVRGFFRLGFDGSAYSPYVSARATAAEADATEADATGVKK